MSVFWSLDSWGADYPPINTEEIIDEANRLIEIYANTVSSDESDTWSYSERLWENFCQTGFVGNVEAVYAES